MLLRRDRTRDKRANRTAQHPRNRLVSPGPLSRERRRHRRLARVPEDDSSALDTAHDTSTQRLSVEQGRVDRAGSHERGDRPCHRRPRHPPRRPLRAWQALCTAAAAHRAGIDGKSTVGGWQRACRRASTRRPYSRRKPERLLSIIATRSAASRVEGGVNEPFAEVGIRAVGIRRNRQSRRPPQVVRHAFLHSERSSILVVAQACSVQSVRAPRRRKNFAARSHWTLREEKKISPARCSTPVQLCCPRTSLRKF